MSRPDKRFSIKKKMYIFVISVVLLGVLGTGTIAFVAGARQIDRYFKQNTADNATNFASMVDGDFLAKLRDVAASDEYQKLRESAEADENETVISDYLKDKGLWDQYIETRNMLDDYLNNISQIKYMYIVAHGDADAEYDMYLIDDSSNSIFATGYYEKREAEFMGVDITNLPEPTISHGDWGWLCSDFKPVYASDGSCVCIIGCDVSMDDVVNERMKLLIAFAIGTVVFAGFILICALVFINKVVVDPLDAMTNEMKRFAPSENLSYEESGVIDLDIKSNDEIYEIYLGIRSMQIDIIDFLNDYMVLQEDNIKAINDIKDKNEQIDLLSVETYKDALTRVGNKAAYDKKAGEMNVRLVAGDFDFGVVMIDANELKKVNDEYGHKAGDLYLKGVSHMICHAFKYSPVFRVGGDEFVVILEGEDYDNRKIIIDKLEAEFLASYNDGSVDPWLRYSAAIGMSEYKPIDGSVEPVYKRADQIMYANKAAFKKQHGGEVR